MRQFRGRDTTTRIGNLDLDLFGIIDQLDTDRPPYRGVTHGIFQQVFQHPLDEANITIGKGQVITEFRFQLNTLLLCLQPELLHDVLYQFGQGKGFDIQQGLTGLQFGKFKQLIDQQIKALTMAGGDLQVSFTLLG